MIKGDATIFWLSGMWNGIWGASEQYAQTSLPRRGKMMRGTFFPLLVGTLGGSSSKGPLSLVTELLECHFH